MTNYTTFSDSELTEALNFHRRQRNMSRGINEAAHARQTQMVRMLEAEEARRLEEAEGSVKKNRELLATGRISKDEFDRRMGYGKYKSKGPAGVGPLGKSLYKNLVKTNEEVDLEEAVSVEKKNYHWGKMITVRHGSSHSFPLHPEHQEKIKNLKDGESTAFKDETGSHVTASREGDKVHLKLRGANQKTTVAHSHFTESIDYSKEKPNKYVIYKHKDKYGVSQDIGTGYNWDHSYHHGYHDTVDAAKAWAAKHAGKYPHKIEVKEEVELDEEFGDYSSKKTSEKKSTTAHPDGKPIHHILHKGEVVGTIEPYSAYREKRKPGSRIVSSRTNVTKYSVHFHADKGPTKSADMPLYHKLGHANVQSALKSAADVHSDWLKKSALKEEAEQINEISKSTLGSYATKALRRADIAARMSHSDSDEMGKIAAKRTAGVKKAIDRLAGKKTAAYIKSNIDKAREAARNRGTDRDDHGKAYYTAQKGISKVREEVEHDEAMEKTHHAARVGTTTWGVGRTPEEAIKDAHKAIHSYYASSAPSRNDRTIDAHMARADKTKKALKVHPIHKSVYDKYTTEEVELDEGYNDPEYIRRAIPALRNAVDFHKELSHVHDKKSTSGSPEYVRAHSAAAKAHREAAERHKIAHAQLSHGSKDVEYYVKPARELGAYAEKLSAKANALKEEFEINEAADLRVTKIYNKWPKKATYAVHTPDRKYFKEFDSMEDAKAHHAKKTEK